MLPLDNILFLQSKYKFSAEIKSQEKTIVHENSFETKNDKHIVIFLPINNIDINLKYSLHLNFLKIVIQYLNNQILYYYQILTHYLYPVFIEQVKVKTINLQFVQIILVH